MFHDTYKADAATKTYRVLFMGDSLTWGWSQPFDSNTPGRAAFDQTFRPQPFAAQAFGFGGDRTEHLLWRIEDGEVDGQAGKAKAVVLLIGTNNVFNGESAESIAAGVNANIRALRCRLPGVKILLLGITPIAGQSAKVAAANALISGLADGVAVTYLDVGPKLGEPPSDKYIDGVHYSAAGYATVAQAIEPVLRDLLD